MKNNKAIDRNLRYIHVKCDLCGGDNPRILFEKCEHSQPIVKCCNCGFIYQNPRADIPANFAECLSEEEILDYEREYLSEIETKQEVFRERLEAISKFKKKGRMLEIGCSYGFFLEQAHNSGWEVYGIEPFQPAAEYLRKKLGNNILSTILIESHFPDNYFDVIVMINVLEHMPSPTEELNEIKRILKPRGLVYVEVPNVNNIWVKILKKRWRYFTDFHYSYFSQATIEKVFQKTGFKVIGISSAPRVVSWWFLTRRIWQLGYLNKSLCSWIEKIISEQRMKKYKIKIDLKDSLRGYAFKD